MVEKIYQMKNRLIEIASRELEMNGEMVNTREMGEVVDMIKDLAEAEKACMEAEYYESIIEAMDEGEEWERMGYNGQGSSGGGQGGGGRSGGQGGSSGGQGGGRNSRMGYRNQYGNWPANPQNRRRMGGRRGYAEEGVENIRRMMDEASPERREQLKRDLENLMREM